MVPDAGEDRRQARTRFARGCFLAAIACLVLLPAAVSVAAVPASGRAWELVTPGETVSAGIAASGPVAASGTSLLYMSLGPLPGAQSGSLASFSRAERGADGWTSTPIDPLYDLPAERSGFQDILPLLPVGPEADPFSLVLSLIPLSSDPIPMGHEALYRRLPDSSFELIAVLEADSAGISGFRYYGGFVEPLADGAVFTTTGHLRPSDAGRAEGRSIYESEGAALRQVDVGEDGNTLSPCGSSISHYNGISSDGSRVFFTSPPSASSCAGPSEVYLREGGSPSTPISTSQCTRVDCGPAEDVEFVGATPDGRFAYLSSAQQLTNDDEDSLRDLYAYDTDDGGLTLLSGGQAAAGGETRGPMAYPSADGAYVYFYARGKLTVGDSATAGANLYVFGPDGLRFVAPAEPELEEDYVRESLQLGRGGEVALFASTLPGSAADTDGRSDVYLYDAGDDALTRLSAGPIGGNGEFDADITSEFIRELFAAKPPFYRALSTDGNVAFFVTAEALVPEDVNTSVDVYEWRQGQLGLVSSGRGGAENKAFFFGASPDGSSVFFRTPETLLPRDRDGGDADVYAARVGGGFAEAGSAPAPVCEASACLPAAGARLTRPLPASATNGDEGRSIRLLKVLRRWAEHGKGTPFELLVTVSSPARISVTGIEPGGNGRKVVRGSERASKPGRVRIPLRLSDPLARALARGGSVRIRLAIRAGESKLVRTVTLRGGSR